MAAVLTNWSAIWADLNTPEAAADYVRVNATMPKIWFNAEGLISAENRNLLDPIMMQGIKDEWYANVVGVE
jgi:hypothetical protein